MNDKDLVYLIDTICHRMKAGIPHTDLRGNFKMLLDDFIKEHNLDTDIHNFATLPKDHEETVLGQKLHDTNPKLMKEICNKLEAMSNQVSVKGIRFKPDKSIEITVRVNPTFNVSKQNVEYTGI